jgi:AraC-like DNA-binding protein
MTDHRQSTVRKLQGLPERVCALLVATDNGRYPRLENVAASLCMSSRTLKRYLQEHGLSFQQLLDRVRRADALRLLEQPELTLDDIARRLGYSSRSNFSRAFQAWVGQSPGRLRPRIGDAAGFASSLALREAAADRHC